MSCLASCQKYQHVQVNNKAIIYRSFILNSSPSSNSFKKKNELVEFVTLSYE